ncbi:hypothetical protein DIPPA_19377 [Diplonema papillatum]|nr:hypothetical protein DIPPA_19377 [Diplonema papillatum]
MSLGIGNSTVKTLKAIAQGDGAVGDELLKKLCQWTLGQLEGKSDVELEGVEGEDGLVLRSVHSALAVLYTEAARQGLEVELADFLEGQCGWSDAQRVSLVASKEFQAACPRIRESLGVFALANPAVESCAWRVDHVLGDRELDVPTRSGAAYCVSLGLTEGEPLNLLCSSEQMQIFAEKLRDMLTESQRVHH